MNSAINATVTMDVAGRLVLPKAVRESLHLRAGSKLTVEIVADRIELTPAANTDLKLVRKGKRLVLARTGLPFDAAAAVRADHEALASRGARR
jgi:AbrB family looped-hinge helix DNA binding protein